MHEILILAVLMQLACCSHANGDTTQPCSFDQPFGNAQGVPASAADSLRAWFSNRTRLTFTLQKPQERVQ